MYNKVIILKSYLMKKKKKIFVKYYQKLWEILPWYMGGC